MKAAIFKRQDEMAVIDVPEPGAANGHVVVKVHDCGICGSDLRVCQYGYGVSPGSIMGHEFCGEIVEVGAGVRAFGHGDRVAVLPFVSCGSCGRCKRGLYLHCHNSKEMGFGQLPGGYAEYVACDENSLFKLPNNLSSRIGALIEPLSVGLHAVKRSGLRPAATVVVVGAGPIGLAILMWAKARGAIVVASEVADGRCQLAYRLGADYVAKATQEHAGDKLRELTGRSPELIFECTGARGALAAAVSMAGPRAEVVVVGLCMDSDQIQPMTCILKEVNMIFVRGYDRVDFEQTLEAVAAGNIRPQPMITDIIELERVPQMFKALRIPGQQGKVMVELE
jgi:threonine dehydrogenase-like Zn-dependent dehydrogenase